MEFQIPDGKVHLFPPIDCFDGMVVNWSLGMRPDAKLVNTMPDPAIETLRSWCPLSLARLALAYR